MRPGRRQKDDLGLGLALSGGGARGLAQIGAIKALTESGVRIDCIAGTSAGALVGALYAAGNSWAEIARIANETNWRDLVRPNFKAYGFVSAERLEKLLDSLIEGKSFAELEIPFRAVAADLVSGEEVVFDSGPVAFAVRASSSVPGIFAPVESEGRLLVDGGIRNNLPADIVRGMGAKVVVAVDVNFHQIKPGGPENTADVILSAMRIVMNNNKRYAEEQSDFVLRPSLSGFNYYDLKQAPELIARGEAAMLELMPAITAAVAS